MNEDDTIEALVSGVHSVTMDTYSVNISSGERRETTLSRGSRDVSIGTRPPEASGIEDILNSDRT